MSRPAGLLAVLLLLSCDEEDACISCADVAVTITMQCLQRGQVPVQPITCTEDWKGCAASFSVQCQDLQTDVPGQDPGSH